jgi:hypothetical protein
VEGRGSGSGSGVMLASGDVAAFLAEERRSMAAKRQQLADGFPAPGAECLLSGMEAAVMAAARHSVLVAEALVSGVDFIEGMLYAQLSAAIGHEVCASPSPLTPSSSSLGAGDGD